MMDVDEPAYTYSDSVTCTLPLIAEDQKGVQMAGRGALFWDATDPLVAGIHFEVMRNSVVIDPAVYVADEGKRICCTQCNEFLPYGTMGALVSNEPDKFILWCLMCASDHPSTVMDEALWVCGLAELEGVLGDDDPADAGAATVRLWRLNESSFQISLREDNNMMILTAPVDRLETMLQAVRDYEATHPTHTVDNYLDHGFTELEKLANGQ